LTLEIDTVVMEMVASDFIEWMRLCYMYMGYAQDLLAECHDHED
jgi:hypothetical protein